MRVFLMRHAKSLSNGMNVWTGQRDVGLSPDGIAEQLELCSRFQYPRACAYFSSPLLRCTRSLELIYGRKADFLLPELAECSLGSLEGQPYTNLDDDPNYIKWVSMPELSFHGGESFGEFQRRSREAFLKAAAICANNKIPSAVVMTHGNVMRAVLSGLVDSAVPHGKWSIPNGGGYAFEYPGNGAGPLKYERVPDFLFAGND